MRHLFMFSVGLYPRGANKDENMDRLINEIERKIDETLEFWLKKKSKLLNVTLTPWEDEMMVTLIAKGKMRKPE